MFTSKKFSNFSQQILIKILVFVLVGSVKKFYFGSVTDPDLCIFPGSVTDPETDPDLFPSLIQVLESVSVILENTYILTYEYMPESGNL